MFFLLNVKCYEAGSYTPQAWTLGKANDYHPNGIPSGCAKYIHAEMFHRN